MNILTIMLIRIMVIQNDNIHLICLTLCSNVRYDIRNIILINILVNILILFIIIIIIIIIIYCYHSTPKLYSTKMKKLVKNRIYIVYTYKNTVICKNSYIYRVRKKNNPLAKCQYLGQNSIFWLDFLGVCRGDILASNLQIWF